MICNAYHNKYTKKEKNVLKQHQCNKEKKTANSGRDQTTAQDHYK